MAEAEPLLYLVAALLIVGVSTQWFAWRFRLPPILLLVLVGLFAGPVTGYLNPESMLGDLLQPVVALGVAIILFEGGMTLRWNELRGVGRVLLLLVTAGAVVTWLVGTLAAHLIVGVDLRVSLLLGAILTVSGPTVVGPLLTHIRPQGAVASLLKWEGIVIDPVGALLAVFVFLGIAASGPGAAFTVVAGAMLTATVAGTVAGLVAAGVLTAALARYWVPDHLQSAVALAFVFAAYLVANSFQTEAGLLAVTVMGVFLANQPYAPVRAILEFKETLRMLIIPTLFLLLTARITTADIAYIGVPHLVFLAVMILIARPLSVAVSTFGSRLGMRERIFMAGLMPRGIVAAAIASVLAFDLAETGIDASPLVPLAFLVILGTVLFYSIFGAPLAHVLGVARRGTGGALFIGAGPFARALAKGLGDADVEIRLVDTNRSNVIDANVAGLDAKHANALSETADEVLEVERVDHVLALTPNAQTNQLCTVRYAEHVDRASVFRLAPAGEAASQSKWAVGRTLFSEEATWAELNRRLRAGDRIVRTPLTEKFTFQHWKDHHGPTALPLALVHEDCSLSLFAVDVRPQPEAGDVLVGLVPPDEPLTDERDQ